MQRKAFIIAQLMFLERDLFIFICTVPIRKGSKKPIEMNNACYDEKLLHTHGNRNKIRVVTCIRFISVTEKTVFFIDLA